MASLTFNFKNTLEDVLVDAGTFLVKRMCSKRSLARRLNQSCLNCRSTVQLFGRPIFGWKTELVEVEEVVADNHRKTTKFGESEREGERLDPESCCQVKHAARIFLETT